MSNLLDRLDVNRRRRERYHTEKSQTERQSIKYKVKNRVINEVSGAAVKYDGQTLLYENYKEPLKPIEKNKGYGYYGTVALTSDKQYVQCHICGNLYSSLGSHLRKHAITAEKYKEMFQLSMETALISEPVRQKRQELSVKQLGGKGLPKHLQDYNLKVQTGKIKHKPPKRSGISLQKRNELGLCPDQVLDKIKDLQEEMGGKTPSFDEFQARYDGKYLGPIKFQHGSWSNAVRKVAGMTRDEIRRPDNEQLLQDLRDFHEQNGRIPMTSDFNRGMLRPRTLYFARFGTLNNARIEAGLNAVLPMPFGQVVELTPEQYTDYKAGRAVEGIKSPLSAQKKRIKKLKKRGLI